MGKSLRQMTAEVRANNIEKGWRVNRNTYADYIALIHSELAEALEAYRDYRLADTTGPREPVYSDLEDDMGNHVAVSWRPGKPEGVGSELADVVIRLLDVADVYEVHGCVSDMELADVSPASFAGIGAPPEPPITFGGYVAWLHRHVNSLWSTRNGAPLLRALVTVAEKHGIDLTAEYERKMAYNRTRPYQHGGRTLAGPAPTPAPAP